MYHVKWCPHCRSAMPAFNAARQMLARTHPNVDVRAIDCERERQPPYVQGYPTFIFEYGPFIRREYTGLRDPASMHAFVVSNLY